jgi:transcriptional regulator with XRE-family HTH domain
LAPRIHPARLILVERGETIRQCAAAIEFNHQHVSRILRGLQRPSRRFRKALAAHLGVPESELFHDEPQDGAA